MHLVGFIIRIFHNARSPERQIQNKTIYENASFYLTVFTRPLHKCANTLSVNVEKQTKQDNKCSNQFTLQHGDIHTYIVEK